MGGTSYEANVLEQFVAYFKTLMGATSALFAVFAPILAGLGPELTPPWPERVVIFASGTCVFVVIALFFGIRHYSRRRMRLWGAILFVFAVAGGIALLGTNANLVVTLSEVNSDIGEYRVVRGFWLQEDAAKAIEDGIVVNRSIDLLRDFGWESPGIIWTHVALARALVVIAFVLPFSAATGSLAAFALQDFRRRGGAGS